MGKDGQHNDIDSGLRVADSITKLGPEFRGTVLVAGSHGGRYCGYLTALAGLCGVVLNDASGGKDAAGTGALRYLEPLGVPAATVAHTSAKIGDGQDMLRRGLLSEVNAPAAKLGCAPGQSCLEAARAMYGARAYSGDVPSYEEARVVLASQPLTVLGCDSASLVTSEDADALIVTGSHGGALAGRPSYGLVTTPRGAVFNDAGVGIDEAGIARLAILDAQGVPAVTVGADSAQIGDARAAWDDGVISHVNAVAAALGLTPGDRVPDFAAKLAG